MCNQCGMEQQGYVELMSQETVAMVDNARVVKKRRKERDSSEDENDKSKDNDSKGEKF